MTAEATEFFTWAIVQDAKELERLVDGNIWKAGSVLEEVKEAQEVLARVAKKLEDHRRG